MFGLLNNLTIKLHVYPFMLIRTTRPAHGNLFGLTLSMLGTRLKLFLCRYLSMVT